MKTIVENFKILVPRHHNGSTSHVSVKLSLVQTRSEVSIKEGNWLAIATSLLSSRKHLGDGEEVILTQDDCILHCLTHNGILKILGE